MTERFQGRRMSPPVEEPQEADDPAEGAAPGLFTCFIREWEPGREPDPALTTEMWSAFGQVVRDELRRRSLSQGAPQWLGIYGFRGWWEMTGRSGPFEDLLAEAFRYVFVERFAALKAQTRAKADIEGLVRASVRHFLHDRQRLNDRLGARLFEVLSLAVRRALTLGDLTLVAGSSKIGSSTVLSAGIQGASNELAKPETLSTIVRRWNDDLLPDLVTASRADKRRLVEELARRLAGLRKDGISCFRFGDLISPLRTDVRLRWAALLEPDEGETGDEEDARDFCRLQRTFEPTFETRLIAADRFAKLIDCADEAIEMSPESGRTRDHLRKVLLFLRAFAADEGEALAEEGSRDDEDRLPSFRRLADHLGIDRERLKQLVGTLKGFLKLCGERLDGEFVRVRVEARS